MKTKSQIQTRLEYLRGELRAEQISYGELAELQSLAPHIKPDDVELLQAAGVPESTPAMTDHERYQQLQTQMRQMIREGKIHYQLFDDAFAEMIEIEKRHGGFPPMPDDYDAQNMELAEQANMGGTR